MGKEEAKEGVGGVYWGDMRGKLKLRLEIGWGGGKE